MKNHRHINNGQIKCLVLSALIASLAVLQGCATSVSKLSHDGKNDEIIFPQIEQNTWMKEGTFPNLDNLRNVAPGMTKNQIYALIGHPHFSEGFGKVREWDYIFNFRPKSDGKTTVSEVETCQYKIIYAENMRLQNTYWKPESCAQKLILAATQAPIVIEKKVEKLASKNMLSTTQLSADGMFDFDQSAIQHLRPGGIEKLDRLAANLISATSTKSEITELKIIGHTDRLGDDAYNIKLSQARAETIRQYLITKNIPAQHISAAGVGKSMPLVECNQTKRDEALIRCLEPNRRFEIEAWVSEK